MRIHSFVPRLPATLALGAALALAPAVILAHYLNRPGSPSGNLAFAGLCEHSFCPQPCPLGLRALVFSMMFFVSPFVPISEASLSVGVRALAGT